MKDPMRLLDLAPRGSRTRTLLEAGAVKDPALDEIVPLWGKLAARLPSVGGAAAGGAAGGAVGGTGASVAAVVVGTAVALGLAVVVAAFGLRTNFRDARAPCPPDCPAAAPAPEPPVVVDEPAKTSPATPIASTPAAPSAAPVKPTRLASKPMDPEGTLREESRLLVAARATLRAGDCPGALGQLDALRARFPSGVLGQEREVLTIQALACAGRGDEAGQRASAFLRAYPASPHVRDVETLVP